MSIIYSLCSVPSISLDFLTLDISKFVTSIAGVQSLQCIIMHRTYWLAFAWSTKYIFARLGVLKEKKMRSGSSKPMLLGLRVEKLFSLEIISQRKFFLLAMTIHSQISFPARQVPFRVIFKTNADEATVTIAATSVVADAQTSELVGFPSGSIGFSLKYVQSTC